MAIRIKFYQLKQILKTTRSFSKWHKHFNSEKDEIMCLESIEHQIKIWRKENKEVKE